MMSKSSDHLRAVSEIWPSAQPLSSKGFASVSLFAAWSQAPAYFTPFSSSNTSRQIVFVSVVGAQRAKAGVAEGGGRALRWFFHRAGSLLK